MSVTDKPRLHQDWIDPHASEIVRKLQNTGHVSYLVGGCVRDLLLGKHPKDFDIATDATPDEVKRAIYRSYIIGKRFRLVLVRREDQQYEISTFRREIRNDEMRDDLPAGDNLFGTPAEDARRRDFTINALFYDPVGDQLIDHAQGLKDLEDGWVRMIGEPSRRLAEDPIRILRALRLKHMISFSLEPELRQQMSELAHLLPTTVLPRRREEILKWLKLKNPDLAFREAVDMGILNSLSPTLARMIQRSEDGGELFFDSLRGFSEFLGPANEPKDYFSRLAYAYVRAFLHPIESERPLLRNTLEEETFQTWMRNELGMFKTEQALATKSLAMQSILRKRGELERKGSRRKAAVFASPAFDLALMIARHELSLSCDDLSYWSEKPAASGGRPRRHRRGRRRPKQR